MIDINIRLTDGATVAAWKSMRMNGTTGVTIAAQDESNVVIITSNLDQAKILVQKLGETLGMKVVEEETSDGEEGVSDD